MFYKLLADFFKEMILKNPSTCKNKTKIEADDKS